MRATPSHPQKPRRALRRTRTRVRRVRRFLYVDFPARIKAFVRDVRGIMAVEFALTFPILAALTLAGIDVVQLAQARQGAASLATSACASGGRAGFIPSLDGDNIGLDFDAANAAAIQSFDTNKDSAFMVTTPATFEAVAVEPNLLRCTVTVTVTPIVGFLDATPKTLTQIVVE